LIAWVQSLSGPTKSGRKRERFKRESTLIKAEKVS
jgi:hypothetical protein